MSVSDFGAWRLVAAFGVRRLVVAFKNERTITIARKRQQGAARQIMRLRNKLTKWLRGSMDAADKGATERDAFDEDDNIDPFNPFPDPITIEITDEFDLHSIAPRDVKCVVEEYLTEARSNGFRSVRIIHGKGIGVQREMVRTILARTPFVVDFMDAPAQAGGSGATIAHFMVEQE